MGPRAAGLARPEGRSVRVTVCDTGDRADSAPGDPGASVGKRSAASADRRQSDHRAAGHVADHRPRSADRGCGHVGHRRVLGDLGDRARSWRVRSRWSILISIATLCLAGCSTHDAKFDSVLAPVSPSPVAGASFLQNAAGGLLLRYANHESALSTESLALLAQASADGYIAIRDSWKARAAYLVQTARGLASVLERRRVPLDGGRAFTVGTRRRTGDPMVSAIAGDAFVDVFLATGGHSYAAAAS